MTVVDNKKIKAFEELEFRDDFMFGCVMQDKELCHDVLECLQRYTTTVPIMALAYRIVSDSFTSM